MTFRTPTFERLVLAGAVRLSRELSISSKSRVNIFIIAYDDNDLRIDGTDSIDKLRVLLPDITAACAEVA